MESVDQVSTEEMADLTPDFTKFETLSKEMVSRIQFYGRTMDEWSDTLLVDIPKNEELTPDSLREVFLTLSKKIQQASYFYSVCNSFLNTFSAKAELRKAFAVKTIVENIAAKNAKRPGAKIIEKLAEAEITDFNVQLEIAKVLKEFFREKRDTLIEVRKCMEPVAMSQTMQMKYHEL